MIKINEHGVSQTLDFETARRAIRNRDDRRQITFGTRTNRWHVIDEREQINYGITGLSYHEIENADEQTAYELNMRQTVNA